MIGFRQVDPRYPFLWEDETQPPARWHGEGDGPAHYFTDTPDGAWAEFIRHEEITDLADLAGIHRAVWAVELDDRECVVPAVRSTNLLGDESTYATCQQEARSLRSSGAVGIDAPSAALLPGEACGYHVNDGLRRALPPEDGRVLVLFGRRPDLVGWLVAADARPAVTILDRVRHF